MKIKDIADYLGMSPTTVSNVIHGKNSEVSADTIAKVKEYLERVHYIPNINARNLAQNRSKIIGFVLKESDYEGLNIFTDPFAMDLLGSVEREIRSIGYFMMIYISKDIQEIIRYVSSWNVDGLILFAPSKNDVVEMSSAYHKPMVFIDTHVEQNGIDIDQWIVNIGLDDEKAGYDGTRFLIDKGHRKIGFLTRMYMGSDQPRYQGYKKAMEEAGIECVKNHCIICGDKHGIVDYKKTAERVKEFTALFTCSDAVAIQLMNTLQNEGVRIPEDFSMMGFDDNASCIFANPPLTTIKQDIPEKGRLAVQQLFNMLSGKYPKTHNILLPTKIVERNSVKQIN